MMDRGERIASAVEQQLQCPICLLKLRVPRLLECMHTFCEECIANVAKHSQSNSGVLVRCPTCRQMTMVSDVTKLPKNYIVENIIEALEEVKEDFKQDVPITLKSKGSDSITSLFTPVIAQAFTSNTSSNHYSFDTIPSFNFGQRDKASFAVLPTTPTTNSSAAPVSLQYTSQNSGLSLSLPAPALSSSQNTKVVQGSGKPIMSCNLSDSAVDSVDAVRQGRRSLGLSESGSGLGTNTERHLSGSVFKFNASDANMVPCFGWGSVDQTSFM